MTQDRRARILMVQELVQEQMDDGSEWVEGEIANVFGEDEAGKSDGEREVGESRLGREKS